MSFLKQVIDPQVDIILQAFELEQTKTEGFQVGQVLDDKRQFDVHQAYLKQVTPELVYSFLEGVELFLLVIIVFRFLAEICLSNNEKFTNLGPAKRWFYASYLNSICYSIYLVAMVLGDLQTCQPPARGQGNMFTNTWCRDHTTLQQLKGNAFVIGVLTQDLIIQIFLVRDFTSSAALLNFLHHFLSIFGAFTGIYVGRFFGPISNITLITEASTVFVSLRWLLYFHDLASTTTYLINGLLMTGSFFIVRVCFMTYLVFAIGNKANSEADFEGEPDEIYVWGQVSLAAYYVLLALNFFWFKKMAAGTLKYLFKKDDSKTASSDKNKRD